MIDLSHIDDFERPVILFSGGLDSTLLLALLKENGSSTDIVTVGRETWGRKQKERFDALVKEWDLTVLSYPPSRLSFVGDAKEITAVYEYAVGGAAIPLLRDVIEGDKCIAELDGYRMHESPINFDLYLVGSRKADKHWTIETVAPKKEWKVGEATFLAPLHDLSREEVQEMLKERGLPWEEVPDDEDSGNISLCDKCLRAIEPVECPKDGTMISPMGVHLENNLKAFRKQFVH
jgi:3'-phosphoadenosine 5'-phosphosulfate sulfotransferase (PAPS reductase)/FAD synthetase